LFVRQNVAKMQPYVPGEQPIEGGFVKLNTNENPYPPSPEVVRALLAEAWGALNLYPDPMANPVRDRLAQRFHLDRGMFLVGNGGDDLLTIITRCLAGEGDTVAYPVPTYILYETLADLQGSRKLEVPYAADFALPPGLFGSPAKVTFLANPNSPSGTSVPQSAVQELAASLKGVLVVDEAYVDFADESCIFLVGKVPNLCVLRSFSKSFSLAGLRIGYVAAGENLITEFVKAKDSYNVNRLSIAAAAAALDDYDYMLANVAKIRRTRGSLTEALTELGFSVLPSQANFIWAKAPEPGAAEIYQTLKSRRILVRFWDRGELRDYLRISIGTRGQIDALLAAVRDIVGVKDAG